MKEERRAGKRRKMRRHNDSSASQIRQEADLLSTGQRRHISLSKSRTINSVLREQRLQLPPEPTQGSPEGSLFLSDPRVHNHPELEFMVHLGQGRWVSPGPLTSQNYRQPQQTFVWWDANLILSKGQIKRNQFNKYYGALLKNMYTSLILMLV